MTRCDAFIVGGGPAGSTCARLLRQAGWDVRVVDRAKFPRDKVCAGWLTPEVFPLLDLTPDEYCATGLVLQAFSGFKTGVIGDRRLVDTAYPQTVSYAIRRCEFDDFLLRRANVPVEQMNVTSIARTHDGWIVNDAIQARVLIGAGGHFCPVSRYLRGGRDTAQPVVAKEAEFRLDGRTTTVSERTPALYFCRDLEGYAWVVRKGEYVNVGIGRRDRGDFGEHLDAFAKYLEDTGTLTDASTLKFHGHAYLAEGTGPRPMIGDGVLLIGDAIGLAYPESGEGIKPAIESGRRAAETLIAAHGRCTRDALKPYEDAIRRSHPPAPHDHGPLHGAIVAIGRALLGSRLFTRHVVLDRWFLRRA
jgi:geranylgeranyl reductase family protein